DLEDGRDRDPVLGEDLRAGDRLPEPPGADERDVVLPLGTEDLADLAEQPVDRVADAPLAELAEIRQVAPDLRRVDVRVVGDLLRGDPVLAHLLRLRQDLQIAREARGDADTHAILERTHPVDRTLQHNELLCPNAWTNDSVRHKVIGSLPACDVAPARPR